MRTKDMMEYFLLLSVSHVIRLLKRTAISCCSCDKLPSFAFRITRYTDEVDSQISVTWDPKQEQLFDTSAHWK